MNRRRPDWGCLAVEYTATGQVAHAYPHRSDELEQAADAAHSDEFPREFSPAFSFTKDVTVIGLSGSESISFEHARRTFTLKCRTGRPYLDTVGMIDGNGPLSLRGYVINSGRGVGVGVPVNYV